MSRYCYSLSGVSVVARLVPFFIFSIDRSTCRNILDFTSSECSFLAYVNVTDWMGFRYENECGLTGFISI